MLDGAGPGKLEASPSCGESCTGRPPGSGSEPEANGYVGSGSSIALVLESLRPKRLPSVARRGFRFGVVESGSTAFPLPLPFFNVAPRDVSAPSDGLLRSLSAERLALPRSLEDLPPELAPGDADPVVVVAGARSQGG